MKCQHCGEIVRYDLCGILGRICGDCIARMQGVFTIAMADETAANRIPGLEQRIDSGEGV